MAFEAVQIQSTLNGVSLVVGFREDLAAGDVVALSLTSTAGISTVAWYVKGRPEASTVGGPGPEPCLLATALTAAFTADNDADGFRRDGTYMIEAVINPGAPGETRKTVLIARLSGLTIAGPGGTVLPLRKMGGFEATEDAENPLIHQGYKTQQIRWLEWSRQNSSGGGGGIVQSVTAGPGISITGTLANPIVNNTGVITITAGPGISITGTAQNPIVNNTGVLSVSAGTNVSIGGTAQNPIISSSGGGGGGANATLFRRTNIAAMVAIDTSGFLTSDSHLCEVSTVSGYFKFVPGVTLTADGITIVTNGAVTGQWVRLNIPDKASQLQLTWSVDESNVSTVASDENSGVDDAHPLRTLAELLRRVGRWYLRASTTVVVRWLSDTTRASYNLSEISVDEMATGATSVSLIFLGVPTVIRSGTLSAATDAPWTVTDSALATSWSAAGCLSTSSATRIIRKTDGTKHACMGYEDVAKTASTSPTNAYSNAASSTNGTAAASFAGGDAYEVISLPKFPQAHCPANSSNFLGTFFIYLDLGAILSGRVAGRLCGWRASGSGGPGDSGSALGCTFTLGGGMTFSALMNRCIILGAPFTLTSLTGVAMSGNTNVVAKAGALIVRSGGVASLGTIYAFSCTGVAIAIASSCNMVFNGIRGAGNAAEVLQLTNAGATVTIAGGGTVDATTSAPGPVTVSGVSYQWADIPIWQLNKASGVLAS